MRIKEKLQSLSEDELRKKVVIPVLKLSGFRNVEEWCGPQEQGKDVLYVKEDPLSESHIVGAVLIRNNGDIKKSGRADIRDIKNKAEEAIMTSISDPLDPYSETTIGELYILTSFDIKREARNYILNVLRNSRLYLRFMPGDKLENRIKKIIGGSAYAFDPDDFEEFCNTQMESISAREKETIAKPTFVGAITEGRNIEPELARINQIVLSGRYSQNKHVILSFARDEELRPYLLSKLPNKLEDLRAIEFLLEELVKDERPSKLVSILRESVSKRNSEFIIRFVTKHYERLGGSFG